MASLTTTLNQLWEGRFVGEASNKLTELVQAVEETGKGGSITLTIAIKQTSGSRRTLTIAGDLKAKIPEAKPDVTLMFVDEEGGLHTEDPKQLRLSLEAVPDAKPKTLEAIG